MEIVNWNMRRESKPMYQIGNPSIAGSQAIHSYVTIEAYIEENEVELFNEFTSIFKPYSRLNINDMIKIGKFMNENQVNSKDVVEFIENLGVANKLTSNDPYNG